jgi:hypothetical protein
VLGPTSPITFAIAAIRVSAAARVSAEVSRLPLREVAMANAAAEAAARVWEATRREVSLIPT